VVPLRTVPVVLVVDLLPVVLVVDLFPVVLVVEWWDGGIEMEGNTESVAEAETETETEADLETDAEAEGVEGTTHALPSQVVPETHNSPNSMQAGRVAVGSTSFQGFAEP